jgi:hypothetical protein
MTQRFDEGGRRRLKWMVAAGALASPVVIVAALIAVGFMEAHAKAEGGRATGVVFVMAALVGYLALLGWGAWRLFGPRRSSDGRVRRASAIQVLIGTGIASLIGGLLAGLFLGMTSDVDSGGELIHEPAFLPLVLGMMLFSGVATVVYYRRLDEAALEAHKFAWLWGAQSGLFVATCLALIAFITSEDTGTGMDGVFFTVSAAFIGYGIAWGVWWFRKR